MSQNYLFSICASLTFSQSSSPSIYPSCLPTLYRQETIILESAWQDGKLIVADIRPGPVYGELPVIQ